MPGGARQAPIGMKVARVQRVDGRDAGNAAPDGGNSARTDRERTG